MLVKTNKTIIMPCNPFRYLLEAGANISSVNNDGELAVDISESDEMEDLLQKEIEVFQSLMMTRVKDGKIIPPSLFQSRGVDCEEARNREERMMLEDANSWLNSGRSGDTLHNKTGATALHVAAAKGYNRVLR